MSNQPESIALFYTEGSSDKEYRVQLRDLGDGTWMTLAFNGRRGNTLTEQKKTPAPVDYATAKAVYDKAVKEKTKKGYTPDSSGAIYQGSNVEKEFSGFVPQLLNSLRKPEDINKCLVDDAWIAQEKHDGQRRPIQLDADGSVRGLNKEGVVVSLPMNVVEAVKSLGATQLLLDGEIIGERYIAFDLLELDGNDLRGKTYDIRLALLERTMKAAVAPIEVVRTARGTTEKKALREALKSHRAEGVVYKKLAALYAPGRPASGGSQMKDKFVEDCTVQVCSVSATKRSVMVACLRDQRDGLTPIGNVTIPSSYAIPTVGELVKVEYLYLHSAGGSLYQPVYRGPRLDQSTPDAYSQFKIKAEHAFGADGDDEAPEASTATVGEDVTPKPAGKRAKMG